MSTNMIIIFTSLVFSITTSSCCSCCSSSSSNSPKPPFVISFSSLLFTLSESQFPIAGSLLGTSSPGPLILCKYVSCSKAIVFSTSNNHIVYANFNKYKVTYNKECDWTAVFAFCVVRNPTCF